jgi:competence protein ComEC
VIFISALLQAALALPMAVYFHRATTLALPANFVVVPIMSLLLPTALATTLLSYLGTWVIFLPRCVTALLLHSVSASIFALSRFRAADVRVPDPPIWAAALCIAALIACIVAARTHRIIVFGALALLAITDWGVIHARKPDSVAGKLEITAIDVGQGDSLLIVTPHGKSLLIDGGGTLGASSSGFDIGEDVVSPYLWARGFSHLDSVALSHPHGDHIGGLPAVLNNFHPAELWVAPAPINAAYESLVTQAKAARVLVKDLAAGDRLEFGGANIDVLAPFGGSNLTEKRGNDDSMVLKISFGATSALLEGDAERHTERLIAPELGPVNLLKVAHHGSSTSSISELINAIRPQFAVISVGQFNRYGHPRPEVLERLRAAGACTFRTDFNGAVSFYLDGTALTSARWGRQRQAIEFPSRWIPPNQAGHCAGLR